MRWGLLLVSLVAGVLKVMYPQEWIHSLFLVSMAGVVGYFTNYLAIKMLFHPRQGKVLGWQGLIPKNKAHIARSLAANIQNRLLAPDILLDYVHRNNLIEVSALELSRWMDAQLNREETRKIITLRITGLLKEKGPDVIEKLFLITEESFREVVQDKEEIERLWFLIRAQIARFMYQEEHRRQVADTIHQAFQKDLPRFSELVNQALDEYLQRKGTFGTMGKGLKQIIRMDSDGINAMLEKFIHEPEVTDQLLGVLDILMEHFLERLNSFEMQDWIGQKIKEWTSISNEVARKSILSRGIDRLTEFLDVETNWEILDGYFLKLVEWSKAVALEYVNTGKGRDNLRVLLNKLLPQINIRNVIEERIMGLDMEQLERLVLDNTGGNLVVIQVLGGFLGLVAGLVQVDLYFALPLTGLGGIAYLSYRMNQKRIAQIQATSDNN